MPPPEPSIDAAVAVEENNSPQKPNDTTVNGSEGSAAGNSGHAGSSTAPAETGDLIDMSSPENTAQPKASELSKDSPATSEQTPTNETVSQTDAQQPAELLASKEASQPSIENMEASTATLVPEPTTPTGQSSLAVPGSGEYLDPTPKTPYDSVPPSRSPSSTSDTGKLAPERSPTRSDSGFDDKPSASEDERDPQSKSEIQSIMDQFSAEDGGPGEEEVMSPRLEIAGPLLGSEIKHPPRKSSLVGLNQSFVRDLESLRMEASENDNQNKDKGKRFSKDSDKGPEVPPKETGLMGLSPKRSVDSHMAPPESPMSPHATSLHRPPPPEPEPEPDLPFDFHRFLEQLRHRTADPVAKFLRSFLTEFGKKQWMVHEQVKIIGDFLAFITNKMAQCEVWREVSDAEFDNAREGMEKLVMNRLYTQTFSPAIPPPQPIPGSRSRRRGGERPLGPGRRGQHQEDVERDDVLAQKISIYGWITEEHLDIPPVGDSGKRFLILAQQELLKIKTYRAPRDKIICVLNCCKVIFGLLKHSKSDSSADSFMPLLIYTVLRANPEHLVSNVQYILRFRNQDKLGGEAGYYLSSLLGAVQFIENLDRTSLTISDEEFEKNVETAVSAIAEKHRSLELAAPPPPPPKQQVNEKSGAGPSHARKSTDEPRQSTSSYAGSENDDTNEKGPVPGLLRSIQRPLSTIGRIFGDDGSSAQTPPPRSPHLSPNRQNNRSSEQQRQPSPQRPTAIAAQEAALMRSLHAEEAAARQASAEAAEVQRMERAEHANVVETLAGMFPDLDRELISDVVAQKNGRVGLAVDACLALSS